MFSQHIYQRGADPARAADGGADFGQSALAPGVAGLCSRATPAPSNLLRGVVGHLPEIERRARLRALGALVRAFAGPTGSTLASGLRKAESDDAALDIADAEFAHLPSLTMRQILSAWPSSF
jgi:hypothetical protein